MVEIRIEYLGDLQIEMYFVFPRRLSDPDLALLSAAVNLRPVARSLHPELELHSRFSFAE